MDLHTLFGEPAGEGIDLADPDGSGHRKSKITPERKQEQAGNDREASAAKHRATSSIVWDALWPSYLTLLVDKREKKHKRLEIEALRN
jgi:hypothetical protein